MKVIVIRFSSLGDIAIMIPMLHRIKYGIKDCTLHVVTRKPFDELLGKVPWIDRLTTLGNSSLNSMFSLIKYLRNERYDAAVDAHNIPRSSILLHELKAPLKIQLKKEPLKKSALIYLKINLYKETKTLYEKYMDLAEKLGALPVESGINLIQDEEENKIVADVMKSFSLDDTSIIAIAPGARWKTKIWPSEKFAALIRKLKKEELHPVLIGGKADEKISKEVTSRYGGSIPDLTGKLSAAGTALFLRKCRLLVTNDSAPLHLAELVGTPVVALYGPTVKEFGYFPRLERSIALEKEMWCRPCSRNGSRFCPTGTGACLGKIGADDVFKAVMKVLSNVDKTEDILDGKQ